MTFLSTLRWTAETLQPSYTSHKRLDLWPPHSLPKPAPCHLTLDAVALSWGVTGPSLRCIPGIRFASWQGAGHQCQAPPAHLLSSTPRVQISMLESDSLETLLVWDDTQAGTLSPHLARKTYYKSQQMNLALRAHSPEHMLPEAAGQEPVMAERPVLTPSTGQVAAQSPQPRSLQQ